MKLIKQCKLFFKEGKSDKVYEIDLCELSDGNYLVNFRYGRRGSTLKEGTKTPTATRKDEAEQLFADLETEKRKKGYQTENEVFVELPSLDEVRPNSMQGTIMHRLQDAVEGKNSFKTKWKTSRVIWKAAHLDMQEAIPYIIRLASKGDELQTYTALYALTRLKATIAEELFRSYAYMSKQKQYIIHIANEGLSTILEGEKREAHIATLMEKIPMDIRHAMDTADTETLKVCLEAYLEKEEVAFMSWLYLACKYKSEVTNIAIQTLKNRELRPPFFKQMRAVYKLAQVRGDMSTVAAIAYRFEKTKPMFNRTMPLDENYPQYIMSLNESLVAGKELRKKDSRLAYSNFTRNHLQHNSLNFIKETGAKGNAKEYLRLAIATLLQYTEEDYTPQNERIKNNYGTYNWNTREYHYTLINDAECSRALMLSTLLFGNDPNRIFEKNMSYILGKCFLKSSSYVYKEDQMTEVQRIGLCSKPFAKKIPILAPNQNTSSDSLFGSIRKLFGKKEQPPIGQQPAAGQQPRTTENPANQAPQTVPQNTRHELFPEYWDAMPESYILLLMKAQMDLIRKFAYRNLSQHPRYEEITDRISTDDLRMLFDTGSEYAGKLAMYVLGKKSEMLAADKIFVASLLSVKNKEARRWAQQVIEKSLTSYTADTDFLIALIFNPHDDCDEWINKILQQTHSSNEQLKVMLGKSVSKLLQMKNSPENNALANKIFRRIDSMASQYYSNISWEVVTHLMSSELSANIIFAGDIVIKKTEWGRPEDVPFELVRLFLEHPAAKARENGIALLRNYPDNFIRDHKDDFVRLANTAYNEVLIYILGRTRVISQANREFGDSAIHHLVYVLVRKEKHENAHTIIRKYILADLREHQNSLKTADIITLIHANYRDSQLTGYEILKNYDKLGEFSIGQVISLGNHEILAIRQWCWKYFKDNVARIRYERDKALSILDSKWDDTRAFAFNFFKTEFSETDWDADTLIAITDSVRADVEAFGKELITQHFKPENALEYLTKLSEHPSTSVQMFVSSYLSYYAADNTEKIKELEYYFRSTLTRVNKGRIAKNRVFAFLQQEALKNEEAAFFIAAIMDDLSAQTTVQDKATCIDILTEIKNLYPASDMHLTVIH